MEEPTLRIRNLTVCLVGNLSFSHLLNDPAIAVTLYKQMPAMYQLDDYDLCMQKPPSLLLAHSTYCIVYAEIMPNESSTLWQQIEKVSQDDKHHFRHDHLFIGVCLERCKKALHTLSKFQIQQLYEGKPMDTEVSI